MQALAVAGRIGPHASAYAGRVLRNTTVKATPATNPPMCAI
jgi:hypothetical protein